MEFNLNKIKNLMQGDSNQPLPSELDWSNMKDGIFDKMQSIEQEEPSPKSNKYSRRRIGVFLILFFVLTIGLLNVFQKVTKDQDIVTHDIVQSPETDVHKRESNNTERAASTSQLEDSGKPLVGKNEEIKTDDNLLLAYEELVPNQDPKISERVPIDIDQFPEYQHLSENNLRNKILHTDLVEATQNTPDTVQNALSLLTENKNPNSILRSHELQALPVRDFDQINF